MIRIASGALAATLAITGAASAQSPAENLGFNVGFVMAAEEICGGTITDSFKRATETGATAFGFEAMKSGMDKGMKMAYGDTKEKTCQLAILAYGPNGNKVSDAYVPPRPTKAKTK